MTSVDAGPAAPPLRIVESMHFARWTRQLVVFAGLFLGYGGVVAPAQGQYVPAHFRDGAMPQIPIQAIGGGEVFGELAVGDTGVVTGVTTLQATPPFTDILASSVRTWRFVPAENDTEPRNAVNSKVLVGGVFRPPGLDGLPLGHALVDLGLASDETPFPIATTVPPYPPLARDSGSVLVEIRVDSRGDVADVRTIRSSPPFDEPAMAAARGWKFRPARRSGRSIDAIAYIIFAFRQPVIVTPGRGSE